MVHIIQSKKAERRRRKISESQGRLHRRIESSFEKSVRSWLSRVRRDILSRLESFGTTQVTASDLFLPSAHSTVFSRLLLPKWNLALWSGIQFEADWIDSQEARQSLVIVRQALDLPEMDPPPSINVDPSPELMRSVKGYLGERQAGVWGQVTRTTHKTLDRAIRKGLAEGDTLDQMTARVRGVLTNYTDYQARRVARTETTGGMNHGGQIERDELGIEEKEWVSTLDSRNRGADATSAFDHLTPDGQVVANDQPFIVSGEELMYPGDGSRGASAGSLINCRCTAVASFDSASPRPKPKRKVTPPKPKVPTEKPAAPEPVGVPPEPEPPAIPKPSPLDKKPAHIGFSGKKPTEFAEKVWEEIGENGITSEAQARRVGRIVRQQIERHPVLSKAKTGLRNAEAELESARRARDEARRRLMEAETDEEVGKAYAKFDKADNKVIDAEGKVAELHRDVNEAYPQAARETLSEVRDLGYSIQEFAKNSGAIFRGGTKGSAGRAMQNLPTDWVRSIEQWAASGKPVTFGEVKRGVFKPRARRVNVSGKGDHRDSVMTHELTHAVEWSHRPAMPSLPEGSRMRMNELQREFLERRAKGEKLSQIYAGSDEYGYKDELLDHYIGKDYGENAFYEVMTMGADSIFYQQPGRNAWLDEDFFEFVLGMLAGI